MEPFFNTSKTEMVLNFFRFFLDAQFKRCDTVLSFVEQLLEKIEVPILMQLRSLLMQMWRNIRGI